MTQIAAIRTHRWTGAEARLLEQLRAGFGEDVCVVFHNRPEGVEPPCDVVDLTADWARAQGLRVTRDWGWRCGDYFFYALRAARPEFDHYWLIEPDVYFTGAPEGFFRQFDGVDADLLGLDPEPMGQGGHMFTASMPDLAHHRAIFALTRASGRALDWLLPRRVENGQAAVGQMRFANDEAFVYSHAMAEETLTVGNLRDHAPEWFEGAQFDTAPDLLEDALRANPALRDKVLHPVHDKAGFKAEVAARVAKRVNFLDKLGDSWDHLDDADLTEMADAVRERALDAMRQSRRRWQMALRRAAQQRAAE